MPSQTLLFRLSKELPCSPPLPDPVPGDGLEGGEGCPATCVSFITHGSPGLALERLRRVAREGRRWAGCPSRGCCAPRARFEL